MGREAGLARPPLAQACSASSCSRAVRERGTTWLAGANCELGGVWVEVECPTDKGPGDTLTVDMSQRKYANRHKKRAGSSEPGEEGGGGQQLPASPKRAVSPMSPAHKHGWGYQGPVTPRQITVPKFSGPLVPGTTWLAGKNGELGGVWVEVSCPTDKGPGDKLTVDMSTRKFSNSFKKSREMLRSQSSGLIRQPNFS